MQPIDLLVLPRWLVTLLVALLFVTNTINIGADLAAMGDATAMVVGGGAHVFTVLFALGRLPGWIAQWREMIEDPATKIGRPRQVYTGQGERDFVPMNERGTTGCLAPKTTKGGRPVCG